jgi:hypothetical protein
MLIPAQNSNKTNYKIQDYFTNRQIKKDVNCNTRIYNSYCRDNYVADQCVFMGQIMDTSIDAGYIFCRVRIFYE